VLALLCGPSVATWRTQSEKVLDPWTEGTAVVPQELVAASREQMTTVPLEATPDAESLIPMVQGPVEGGMSEKTIGISGASIVKPNSEVMNVTEAIHEMSSSAPIPNDTEATGPQKFFLLATPRSGSTWLSLLFRQHSETKYHGNECWRSDSYVSWCAHEWNASAPELSAGASMAEKLDSLFTADPKAVAVGFKWMVMQGFKTPESFTAAMNYINTNDVKIIILDRSNYLRKCYSFYDMQQRDMAGINVHHYGKSLGTKGWDNKTYTIPAETLSGCLKWYDKQGRLMESVRKQMQKPENVLVIKYEDVCGDVASQLTRVKEFLGLQQDIDPGATNIAKIHSGKMEDMIENWSDLKTNLLAGSFADKLEAWEDDEC